MDRKLLEDRKKMIYEFICEELYVPMKAKEMAMVLQVPKSQRQELQEVLDALVDECRVEVSKKANIPNPRERCCLASIQAMPKGLGLSR